MDDDVTQQDLAKTFNEAEKTLASRDQFREKMNMAREKNMRDVTLSNNKAALDKEKLMVQRDIANTKLEIAKENKNRYDVKNTDKKEEK